MLDVCSMSPDPSPRKIIRRDEVLDRTGLSKTGLYDRMETGEFPHQVQLGARAVGWYEDEVQDWIITRQGKSEGASDSGEYSDRPQSKPARGRTEYIATASEPSSGSGSQLPRRRSVGMTSQGSQKAPGISKRGGPPTILERVGMTSDGREMLRDPATGCLLVVIGHMPAGWNSR